MSAPKLTKAQRAELVALYQQGVGTVRLARMFGVTRQAALYLVARAGVPRRPTGTHGRDFDAIDPQTRDAA